MLRSLCVDNGFERDLYQQRTIIRSTILFVFAGVVIVTHAWNSKHCVAMNIVEDKV